MKSGSSLALPLSAKARDEPQISFRIMRRSYRGKYRAPHRSDKPQPQNENPETGTGGIRAGPEGRVRRLMPSSIRRSR